MTEPDAWRWKTKHQGWRLDPCKWNVEISGDTDIEAEDIVQQEPLFSASTIQEEIDDARHYQKELETCTCPKDKKPCKHKIAANQVKNTLDFFEEEFKQKGVEPDE